MAWGLFHFCFVEFSFCVGLEFHVVREWPFQHSLHQQINTISILGTGLNTLPEKLYAKNRFFNSLLHCYYVTVPASPQKY